MITAKSSARAVGHQLLNWLYPPLCLQCRTPVGENGAVCVTCWEQLEFIAEPCCAICGYPFAFDVADTALCGMCLRTPPPYIQARSVLRYTEHSRPLITRLKYADHTQLAPAYGRWLAAYGHSLVSQSEMIIPVPLHYRRFVQRRFNQSALLAATLSRQCGLPMIPDAMLRTRHTQPQASLSRNQRLKNVQGAFRVHPKHALRLAGKRVLLIDDVMTTSATIHACCMALSRAKVSQIYVLTLARKFS